MSKLGNNIKHLRQTKNISQDRLSKLADVSPQTIIKIELDEKPNPKIETVQKIAKALGVSIDNLMK
ncbi:helix-turn-helix domain-containing protein [Patescibacteria group bacterium]|nr:helix-turn-helix domain-containing protein [Patescibacteria group bacterium]